MICRGIITLGYAIYRLHGCYTISACNMLQLSYVDTQKLKILMFTVHLHRVEAETE